MRSWKITALAPSFLFSASRTLTFFFIPHSAFHIPHFFHLHSDFRLPHSRILLGVFFRENQGIPDCAAKGSFHIIVLTFRAL